MSEWIEVAKADDINDHTPVTAQISGITIALIKFEDDIIAFEDRCPHMDFPLSDGVVDNGEIMCIHHGARFCLKSGKVLSPPAFENLTTFDVKVENGKVMVNI